VVAHDVLVDELSAFLHYTPLAVEDLLQLPLLFFFLRVYKKAVVVGTHRFAVAFHHLRQPAAGGIVDKAHLVASTLIHHQGQVLVVVGDQSLVTTYAFLSCLLELNQKLFTFDQV